MFDTEESFDESTQGMYSYDRRVGSNLEPAFRALKGLIKDDLATQKKIKGQLSGYVEGAVALLGKALKAAPPKFPNAQEMKDVLKEVRKEDMSTHLYPSITSLLKSSYRYYDAKVADELARDLAKLGGLRKRLQDGKTGWADKVDKDVVWDAIDAVKFRTPQNRAERKANEDLNDLRDRWEDLKISEKDLALVDRIMKLDTKDQLALFD